jgi:hypothetical protein
VLPKLDRADIPTTTAARIDLRLSDVTAGEELLMRKMQRNSIDTLAISPPRSNAHRALARFVQASCCDLAILINFATLATGAS